MFITPDFNPLYTLTNPVFFYIISVANFINFYLILLPHFIFPASCVILHNFGNKIKVFFFILNPLSFSPKGEMFSYPFLLGLIFIHIARNLQGIRLYLCKRSFLYKELTICYQFLVMCIKISLLGGRLERG